MCFFTEKITTNPDVKNWETIKKKKLYGSYFQFTERLPCSQGGIGKMKSHIQIYIKYSWLVDGKCYMYLEKRNQNIPPKILAEIISKGD